MSDARPHDAPAAAADGYLPPAERARIEAVFDDALDVPTAQRAAWLATRCAGDDTLRREVEALLAAHARDDGILGADVAAAAVALVDDPTRGRQIGPYRVLRELGRGGMGVVYLAERNDGHYRQRVAVKLLRASPDADELHRRFLAERQILASLSHANIAQLLDGGVADGQLPYLVMEYVDGLPITEYCDRHRLDVDARLRLFQRVCGAVHHAHQNLVLHRDLKPGNVLVTAAGEPKLLDFGIAKLLNPGMGAAEQPVTRTAYRLMTPAYASPEQVRGDSLTTTSDVYALGLVLYELLTGRQAHRVTTDAPRAVYEAVCLHEPERPSVRVTRARPATGDAASDGAAAAVERPEQASAARDATPERLRRRLQGDLDAIVMMALRKEPGRRYGSAELLAADVGRHLDGLPVLAHRGSRWYRAGKLLRRHRATAAAAAVGALALVGGASGALWQARVADRERERTAAALAQSERALRQSEEVTGFLVGLFDASDPLEGRADALTAVDLLRRGVARAERLAGEPLVQARMLDALGRVHANLGDLAQGETLVRRALALRRAQLGADHPETASTASRLAEVLRRRGRYAEAGTLAQEALRARRAVPGAHAQVAASLRQLSGLAVYRGDLAGAEALAREAVAEQRRGGAAGDSLAARDLEALGGVLWRRGDLAGAVEALREAEATARRTRRLPDRDHAEITLRLAEGLVGRPGGRAEAESLTRAAVAELRSALGPAHPQTAAALTQLGALRAERGAPGADALLREALALQRRASGPWHPSVAGALDALAAADARAGRLGEAEALRREAVAIWERSVGPQHSAYAGALANLGDVLAARGALDSAEALHRRALAIRTTALGPENGLVGLTAANLAGVLTRQRRFAEAESTYLHALSLMRRQINDEHPDVRRTYAGLATLYDASGRPAEAARYRRLAAGR